MIGRRFLILILLVIGGNLGLAQMKFTDVTDSSGVSHSFEVFEGMFGGGACVLDVDLDGYEDFYLTGGMRDDALYVNNGDGTFTNIFEGSGLELTRHFVTQGAASADVNKDGWNDLFITTVTSRDSVKRIPREKNLLFLNMGDNTFKDVTSEYGLEDMNSFSTGASFTDVNLDGYPDLFVGNYFLAYEGTFKHITDATIVSASQTSPDYLLINNSGNRFSLENEAYHTTHKGFGFGGVFTDYDNDADADLIVLNDFGYKAVPNFLYRNLSPDMSFEDISDSSGMDLKINSMAAAKGDFDGNGYLDYYITNIKGNHFMVNNGDGIFYNIAKEAGLSGVTFSISWGANFADFDHDGDLDLFVSNGDLNPNCVPMANFLFENENGHFKEVGYKIGLNDYGIGRGSVTLDFDNDGDMDILVVNQVPTMNYPVESYTRLFRNDGPKGNWLKVSLQSEESISNGIGARVEAYTSGNKMIREIDGGAESYISQNSPIAHFGIGDLSHVDSIVVTWLGGKQQTIKSIQANQMLTVSEVEGELNSSESGFGLYIILTAFLFAFLFILAIRRKKNTSE